MERVINIGGWVYVCEIPGFGIKVGYSKDLKRRMFSISSVMKYKISSIRSFGPFDNAYQVELNCHKSLKFIDHFGEWYNSNMEAIVEIVSECVKYGIAREVPESRIFTPTGRDEITPMQCRIARGGLCLTAGQLASLINSSVPTIAEFEAERRIPLRSKLKKIVSTLERLGAEFIDHDAVRIVPRPAE